MSNLYKPSEDATKEEIISFYKRVMYITIPAFIILSIWFYFDLKDLENGTAENVRVWAPVAFLYKIGGFWLGVLTTPLFGILAFFVFRKKIKQAKDSK